MKTWARATGSPASTQRSQNPSTMAFSVSPASPACVSQAAISEWDCSFMEVI